MSDQRTSKPRIDVLVVGGGIGGLSAAFALSSKGLRVRVLERLDEFGEVGAGMQIAHPPLQLGGRGSHTDRACGPTALFPGDEPDMYPVGLPGQRPGGRVGGGDAGRRLTGLL